MPNPWEPDFPTEEQPYFEYQERERPWAEAQQQWDLLQPDPWEYGQGRNGDPWQILGPQANWAEDSPAEWLQSAGYGAPAVDWPSDVRWQEQAPGRWVGTDMRVETRGLGPRGPADPRKIAEMRRQSELEERNIAAGWLPFAPDPSWWFNVGEDPRREWSETNDTLQQMKGVMEPWIAPNYRSQFRELGFRPWLEDTGNSMYLPSEDYHPFGGEAPGVTDFGMVNVDPQRAGVRAGLLNYPSLLHETAHEFGTTSPANPAADLHREYDWNYGRYRPLVEQMVDEYRQFNPYYPRQRAIEYAWDPNELYAIVGQQPERIPREWRKFYPWLNFEAGPYPKGTFYQPETPQPGYWSTPTEWGSPRAVYK